MFLLLLRFAVAVTQEHAKPLSARRLFNPLMSGIVNTPSRSSVTSPSVRVLFVLRLLAMLLGWYPSLVTARRTRFCASPLTWRALLSTLETVAGETPASLATSLMVMRPEGSTFCWMLTLKAFSYHVLILSLLLTILPT